MPTPPSFRVITVNNLIKADIEGLWDAASDIGYLTDLSQAMSNMRNRKWGLVVDMRGWFITEEMLHFKQRTILHLDRRNQELECWIVDDMAQGKHLFHYVEKTGIPFKRALTIKSANTWLEQYGYSL